MRINTMNTRNAIRRAFNHAATTYDSAACLQQEVGNALLEYASPYLEAAETLIDLGCGHRLSSTTIKTNPHWH